TATGTPASGLLRVPSSICCWILSACSRSSSSGRRVRNAPMLLSVSWIFFNVSCTFSRTVRFFSRISRDKARAVVSVCIIFSSLLLFNGLRHLILSVFCLRGIGEHFLAGIPVCDDVFTEYIAVRKQMRQGFYSVRIQFVQFF